MKDKIFVIHSFQNVKVILAWTILSTIVFTFIYGFCNQLASESQFHHEMYTDWELQIPLVPWMIYPYVSLNLLFVFSAFVLKEVSSIKAFCLSIISGAIVAGLIFYLFPGKLGFLRQSVPGYEHLFDFMFSIDHPHNLFPSLHVTYSTLAIFAMIEQTTNKMFHLFLIIWLAIISLSVLFVHQHHLFDILTGFLLALILYKLVYEKIHIKKKITIS